MFNSSIKVNTKQKSILFEAMARDRDVLEGRTVALRRSKNSAWERLAAKLNKCGPEKDINQWKKCWTDLRLAMRKRYQKMKKSKKYALTSYGRHVIKSCGLEFSDDGEGPDETEVDNELFEFIEEEDIKQELPDETDQVEFVMVKMPPKETTSDHDLMKGTIKIEEEDELLPQSVNSVSSKSDSRFLSEETLIPTRIFAAKPKRNRDETLLEIRKMHRNLLRETKRQTALLKKLVNRLGR